MAGRQETQTKTAGRGNRQMRNRAVYGMTQSKTVSTFDPLQNLTDLGKEQLDFVSMVFKQLLDLIIISGEFPFSDEFRPSGADRIKQTIRFEQSPHTLWRPCLFWIVLLQCRQVLADDTIMGGVSAYSVGGTINDQAADIVVTVDVHGAVYTESSEMNSPLLQVEFKRWSAPMLEAGSDPATPEA
jgi:hypothetical protein